MNEINCFIGIIAGVFFTSLVLLYFKVENFKNKFDISIIMAAVITMLSGLTTVALYIVLKYMFDVVYGIVIGIVIIAISYAIYDTYMEFKK